MRERTESLDAEGGNAFSTETLKASLYHRARSLADDPSTPLFFGRLDYAPGAGPTEDLPGGRTAARPTRRGERFYIGRRHVTGREGDPLVVDWRAPVSRPFYRATRTAPMGVQLRRRFGFHRGD